MRKNREVQKEAFFQEKTASMNMPLEEMTLTSSLNENISTMKKLFEDCDFLQFREVKNMYDKGMRFIMVYCDGLVNANVMDQNIVRPLMNAKMVEPRDSVMDFIVDHIVYINEIKTAHRFKDIVEAVTYGDTILFTEGGDKALLLNSKGLSTRAISEPENEKSISGPHEGFTESIAENLSLVMRRLRTCELKVKYMALGKVTHTKIAVCYLEGIVNKKILNELYRRLVSIDIDGVLDSNYITELIRDNPYSPFRTTGYTERPDSIAAKMLEGRIAVFVDGSPTVLTVPYLFIENFQTPEDYYYVFFYTSFERMLRIIGFIFTITIPAFYVAVVAYQQEMLPTSLLINIASERKSAPLPAALECLVMLIVFDILKETGVRMPSNMGQAMSIVGALVIGQSAVNAKLIAAPMIIVVAFTGITSLMILKMNSPVMYMRFFLLFCAATFGMFGFIVGLAAIYIHILNLHSMGVPQISLPMNLDGQEIKDTFIRAPLSNMVKRPRNMTRNKDRMKPSKENPHG